MARLDINLGKLSVMLLPPVLRGGVLQSLVLAAASALDMAQSVLYAYHMAKPTGTRYRIAHNSQVCYLQAALNDIHDPQMRRIIVDPVVTGDKLFIYYDSELTGLDYLKTHLHSDEEDETIYTIFDSESRDAEQAADFTVLVPRTLRGDEMAVMATINKYKLVGKTYTIQYA